MHNRLKQARGVIAEQSEPQSFEVQGVGQNGCELTAEEEKGGFKALHSQMPTKDSKAAWRAARLLADLPVGLSTGTRGQNRRPARQTESALGWHYFAPGDHCKNGEGVIGEGESAPLWMLHLQKARTSTQACPRGVLVMRITGCASTFAPARKLTAREEQW